MYVKTIKRTAARLYDTGFVGPHKVVSQFHNSRPICISAHGDGDGDTKLSAFIALHIDEAEDIARHLLSKVEAFKDMQNRFEGANHKVDHSVILPEDAYRSL